MTQRVTTSSAESQLTLLRNAWHTHTVTNHLLKLRIWTFPSTQRTPPLKWQLMSYRSLSRSSIDPNYSSPYFALTPTLPPHSVHRPCWKSLSALPDSFTNLIQPFLSCQPITLLWLHPEDTAAWFDPVFKLCLNGFHTALLRAPFWKLSFINQPDRNDQHHQIHA